MFSRKLSSVEILFYMIFMIFIFFPLQPRPVAPSSVNVIEGSSEQVGYENVRNKRSLRVKRENIIRATTVREGGKNLKVVIMVRMVHGLLWKYVVH